MENWINQLPTFLLMLTRLSAFFMTAPIFSSRGIPSQIKIGLSFFLALIAFSMYENDKTYALDAYFYLLLVKEIIVGLALGFSAALILNTIQVAGAFIDFQMGFAIANVVDPQTGTQVPIIGSFKYTLALLFLLAINGHHLLIEGVLKSFELISLDALFFNTSTERLANFMTSAFIQMFIIAFQIAIPIVGALFLVDIALGLLARTVPQVNIFVVGLPLKILLGFAIIFITIPTFFYVMQKVLVKMIQTMGQLIHFIGG